MSHAPWIIGVPGTILCALYYVLSNPEVLDREAYGWVYGILQPFFQYVDKLFAIWSLLRLPIRRSVINVEQRRIPDQLALKADIEPVKVYAYRKTGLIVTEENWGLLSKEQQQEWETAIAEYEERLSGEVQ